MAKNKSEQLKRAREKAPKQLLDLLRLRNNNCEKWFIGKIPKHYKRITVENKKAKEIAIKGFTEMYREFGVKLFYTQSLLAGAILNKEYDDFVVVMSSQTGKSFLMGRIALLLAYRGEPVYIACANNSDTEIIMKYVLDAIKEGTPRLRKELLMQRDKIDKLRSSLSKTRVAFANGGFVECITLGDTFNSLNRNQAIGRSGIFFVDETAKISTDALTELGRRQFSNIDGTSYMSIWISNPHQTGLFYDKLTDEYPLDNELIIWADALTSIEEERFDELQVLNSDFARNKSQLRRYLLCELDTTGESMFEEPKVVDRIGKKEYSQYFLGVDASYKGKDSTCMAVIQVDEDGTFYVEEITKLDRKYWVDGKTNIDIINDIKYVCRKLNIQQVEIDTGWGVWLIQGLEQAGVNVRGVNFGGGVNKERERAKHHSAVEGANMRAEMHLDLADLIENNKIIFSKQAYDQIKDTLGHVTAKRQPSGKILIRPKAEIKSLIGRSPDELDSVLLAINSAITFYGEGLSYL